MYGQFTTESHKYFLAIIPGRVILSLSFCLVLYRSTVSISSSCSSNSGSVQLFIAYTDGFPYQRSGWSMPPHSSFTSEWERQRPSNVFNLANAQSWDEARISGHGPLDHWFLLRRLLFKLIKVYIFHVYLNNKPQCVASENKIHKNLIMTIRYLNFGSGCRRYKFGASTVTLWTFRAAYGLFWMYFWIQRHSWVIWKNILCLSNAKTIKTLGIRWNPNVIINTDILKPCQYLIFNLYFLKESIHIKSTRFIFYLGD